MPETTEINTRAICPGCGRDVTVTKDGKLWLHGSIEGSMFPRCDKSGTRAAPAENAVDVPTVVADLLATTANLAAHIEARAVEIAESRIAEIERHAAACILEAERGREAFEQHWRAVEDELHTRIDRLTGYRDRLQVQVNAAEQLRMSLPADSPLRRLIADALNPPITVERPADRA